MATDTPLLVNDSYPLQYFTLDGTAAITAPNSLFWSSKQRYAAINPAAIGTYLSVDDGGMQTAEYLEIDLGSLTPINYLVMNVLKAPMRITIEYDAISAADADVSGTTDLEGVHEWTAVTPLPGSTFDNVIQYQAQHKNPWHKSEFFFTDPKGNIVHTQFVRIKFARRDVDWPVKNATPFRWPILVRNLRVARYVNGPLTTVGPMFVSPPSSTIFTPDALTTTSTQDVRQQFALPADAVRSNINPNILGFSVFTNTVNSLDGFSMQWSIWDVTSAPTLLRSGVENTAISTPFSWIDVYLDPFNPITTDSNSPRIYELRVSSLNTSVCNGFSTQPAKSVPGLPLPGDWSFTSGSATITVDVDLTATVPAGTHIQKANRLEGVWVTSGSPTWNGSTGTVTLTQPFVGTTETTSVIKALPFSSFSTSANAFQLDYNNSLTMRLWSDVLETGKDILGNTYRTAVRYDDAEHVLDDSQVGWQSAPQPSPDAVEALYFDVRTLVNGVPTSAMIDAVRIAPRTPGVKMHIYYTEANLNSQAAAALRSPQTLNEWDQLIWKPIHVTYTLQNDQIYTLPQPIRAAYVKLEFTHLRPQPFKVAKNPTWPPVKFRRYPTWIETQFTNALVKRAVEDWFVQNKTRVEVNYLKTLTDPVQEFQYKEREFLAALALGKVKVNNTNASIINKTQKALIDPTTGSKIQVNTKDMYKSTLWVNVDPDSVLGQTVAGRLTATSTDPVEGVQTQTPQLPVSSTPNERISESFAYLASTPMWFNRVCRHVYKVDSAQFRTQAYYVGISHVEFLRKDYTVFRDDTIIQDNLTDLDQLEENTFVPDTPSLIANAIYGHDPQTNSPQNTVTVYVSYSVEGVNYTDEQVVFASKTTSVPLVGRGDVAQNVMVSSAPGGQGTQYTYGTDYDIVYSTDPVFGNTINNIQVANFSDRFVVTRGTTNVDASTVLSVAQISSSDQYIKAGTAPVIAAGTIVGVAQPSAVEVFGKAERATVTGVAAPSAGEIYTTLQHIDAATVTSVAVPSAAEAITFGDGSQPLPQLTAVGLHEGAPLSDVLTTADKFALYPDVELFSLWVRWNTLQPNTRNDFVWPASIDTSIDHAEANGYKIALRIACGGDSPTWIYTDPTNPVSPINLIGNDLVTGQITMPIPWDADLLVLYQNLLNKLKPFLDPTGPSGLTAGGTRRSDMIYFIPVSMGMGTSRGCGMGLSYGTAATYTGSATLSAPITGTTTSFTATGANSGSYPTGTFLAKIDNELIYVSRSGGSDVLTVQSSGRGWSGSTATSHATGATVQYASSVPWTGTFNGLTGPYDVSVQNKAEWLAVDTEANNIANSLTAWQNAIDAQVLTISTFSGVPTMIDYGPEFPGTWNNALAIAQYKTLEYPTRLWHMTSDLQPGIDGSNNPTKNGQATYYEGYSTAAGSVVREVIAYGGLLGFQAAPSSTFAHFSNPYSGGTSAFRDVIGDSVTNFSPSFIIVDETELTS